MWSKSVQILSKTEQNLRLSYSELKTENLGAVRHLEFDRKSPNAPAYQFKLNRANHDGVINGLTNFPPPRFFSGGFCRQQFSVANIKYEMEIGQLLRSQHGFQILDMLFYVETTGPRRPNLGQISHFFTPVKMWEWWAKCLSQDEVVSELGRSLIVGESFRFLTCCRASKLQYVKGDWCRKSR